MKDDRMTTSGSCEKKGNFSTGKTEHVIKFFHTTRIWLLLPLQKMNLGAIFRLSSDFSSFR
jgi:hypothetical protein